MIELSTEMLMLGLSTSLGIIQLFVSAAAATGVRGLKWNLSSRDEKQPDLSGRAGRIERSFKNFQESYVFFVAAVLGAQVLNHHGILSVAGSLIYFFCRLAYFPIYVAGIQVVRSIIWLTSVVGIILILIQQLVF